MVETAANALTVTADNVFVKFRKIQTRETQYEKVSAAGHVFPVHEAGLEFLVNLSDYVDTGLFLDHRITRSMVRDLAGGLRVLNLFSYTGSFTVYAAAGGASSTTSVDLSNTYTDWAAENLRRNGFPVPKVEARHRVRAGGGTGGFAAEHRLVTAEVGEFLAQAAARRERYDLIVLDPPTFSNSKKMEGVFDVQRDHAALINSALRLLTRDGLLLFSTNFRRLKLDTGSIRAKKLEEITTATISEDFIGKTPHRCWLVYPSSAE